MKLVRRVLEYNSIIWTPSEQSHILEIETVQKGVCFLYMREYGNSPFPFLSLFLTAMLDFNTLYTRRKLLLGKH